MSILKTQERNTQDMIMLSKAHDWQAHAFVLWQKRMPVAYKYGRQLTNMTIKAITGSGKTYLAVMIAVHHQATDKNARVVVVVPTVSLLNQWVAILRGWNIGNVSAVGGGYRYDRHSPIVVSTTSSLKKLRNAKNLTKGNTLYVLDECHNMASPKTFATLDDMVKIGQVQSIIGLSATPERTDGRCIMDITGRTEQGEPHIVYAYEDALRDGVIPNFTINVGRFSRSLLIHETYEPSENDTYAGNKLYVLNDMSESISKMAMALSSEIKDYYGLVPQQAKGNLLHHIWGDMNTVGWELAGKVNAWKQLTIKRKRLLNNADIRIDIGMDFIRDNIGNKMGMFIESIAMIERIAQKIREGGFGEPFIYHSGENPKDWDLLTNEQKERLATYKKNSKDILAQWIRSDSGILLTCKALKEGLNVPDMGAVCILSHPNAPRPTIQVLGRALRGDRDEDGNFTTDKEIWIINCDDAADDRVIGNIKETGEIPEEQFRYFMRNNDATWEETGNVQMHYEVSDAVADDDTPPPMDDTPPPMYDTPPPMSEDIPPPMTDDTPHQALVFDVETGEMQPAPSA